jgi:RNA polymerase sigma factor (sigma-70 family)
MGFIYLNMTTHRELLRCYATTNSEDAFAEVVRRHVNLVYSAALRQVGGDAHLAHDVAQIVFTSLARHAASLSRHKSLTGWLYTSTHFAAAKMMRGENRRREREEKFMREPSFETSTETDWGKIRPVLDDAMHKLKAADREAILLRYFENQPFTAVGATLGLTENAARMRVERAVAKLRAVLTKRDATLASALVSLLSANAVQIAPANLATTLTTTSIAAAGTGAFTFLNMMSITHLKTGIGILLAGSAAVALVIQQQAQTRLAGENQSLRQQISRLQTDNESLSNRVVAAGDPPSLTSDQLNELLKLRGEVGVLRRETGELETLRGENQRLQAALLDTNAPRQSMADAENQQREIAIQKLDAAKQGMLAFIMFADDNQNQLPTNFVQAATYMGTNMEQVETNFDITYEGSITNIANPAETIVLKEKQAWQSIDGKWLKVYGFADGHAVVKSEPSGNFDDFESQHMAVVPAN